MAEMESTRTPAGKPDVDAVRRKYLLKVHEHTGRDVILYASKFTEPILEPVQEALVAITDEDMLGLMETLHRLKGPNLDLILHSPGGSAEAAEALVNYLRSKFQHIRVIVPHMAMSAACMIAWSADEIVMGKHSSLGPIDPQIVISTPIGNRMAPAQAILDQFKLAQEQCKDPANMAAWIPMLGLYGPDLLVQCDNASKRAVSLVQDWLTKYMFKGRRDGAQKAKAIAEWLGQHEYHKTHGRHLCRAELAEKGLRIVNLEDDQIAQDLFLSVFHAALHSFGMSGAVKIIENHMGKAYVKVLTTALIQGPQPPGSQPGPQPASQPPAQSPGKKTPEGSD
jgi:hypothetical protein